MADVMGPGERSHPKEIQAFREEAKRLGVDIIEHEHESLGYSPGLFPGTPGQLLISKGASYSACKLDF